MRQILIRTLATYLIALAIGALAYLFFESSLYTGPRTAVEAQTSLINFLIVLFVLVAIKFAIYDSIASAILKRYRTSFLKISFYGGYVVALAIDLFSIFMAFQPIYMNLALYGTIAYSPPILLLALILLTIGYFVARRKNS